MQSNLFLKCPGRPSYNDGQSHTDMYILCTGLHIEDIGQNEGQSLLSGLEKSCISNVVGPNQTMLYVPI